MRQLDLEFWCSDINIQLVAPLYPILDRDTELSAKDSISTISGSGILDTSRNIVYCSVLHDRFTEVGIQLLFCLFLARFCIRETNVFVENNACSFTLILHDGIFRYTSNCVYCQNSVCGQTYIQTHTHTRLL